MRTLWRTTLLTGGRTRAWKRLSPRPRPLKLTTSSWNSPDGYQHRIGERGAGLSGGQRQRTALARTLLLRRPILMLDDATASVDTETEYRIYEGLKNYADNCTKFVVAQRVSTIKEADLILVMEQGRIVDQGAHEELVQRDGFYARIYDIQLRDQERMAALAREAGWGANGDETAHG